MFVSILMVLYTFLFSS